MSVLGDLRVVAVHRDFRKLFAVRLVSQCGDGMFQAGLATLFFFSPERMATAADVAAAFAVLLLPFTVVGPFAGPAPGPLAPPTGPPVRQRRAGGAGADARGAHGDRRRRAAGLRPRPGDARASTGSCSRRCPPRCRASCRGTSC